jgi:hypothetical protein
MGRGLLLIIHVITVAPSAGTDDDFHHEDILSSGGKDGQLLIRARDNSVRVQKC